MQRGAGDGAALEVAASEVLTNTSANAKSSAADATAPSSSAVSSPPNTESVPATDPIAVTDVTEAVAAVPAASFATPESDAPVAVPSPVADIGALVGEDSVDDDFDRLLKPKVAQKPDTKKSKTKEGGKGRQAVALLSE